MMPQTADEQRALEPLQRGDKVARLREFGGQDLRHGEVAEVNGTTRSNTVHSRETYGVLWYDTGLIERGYLRIGLIFEGRNA